MKLSWQRYFTARLVLAGALLFPLIAGLAAPVCAQRAGARSSVTSVGGGGTLSAVPPFEVGEELTYVAEFSRALLKKVDVADFRFTVSREQPSSKSGETEGVLDRTASLLRLRGVISSRGFFSRLFNLHFREEIESTIDHPSFRVKRTRKTDEQGKRARTSETTYDNGVVHWVERDPKNPAAGVREASAKFEGQIQDLLSAIYYLRTQPLATGKTFVVTVSDSGRVFAVPVHVLEKKRMKTTLGRIEVLRADADVFGPAGMIPSEGRFSIWFTSDSRHIPVSARIKNEYGTFDITLRKAVQLPTARQSLALEN
jgi:hypothetical protein